MTAPQRPVRPGLPTGRQPQVYQGTIFRQKAHELRIIQDAWAAREWLAAVLPHLMLDDGRDASDEVDEDGTGTCSASQHRSEIDKLFEALRDGVTLCALVAEVLFFVDHRQQAGNDIILNSDAGEKQLFLDRVREHDGKARPRLRAVANLNLFLDTCRSRLRMDEAVLFAPDDLLMRRDLPQVVRTIHVLGSVAAEKNFRPPLQSLLFGPAPTKPLIPLTKSLDTASRSALHETQQPRFKSIAANALWSGGKSAVESQKQLAWVGSVRRKNGPVSRGASFQIGARDSSAVERSNIKTLAKEETDAGVRKLQAQEAGAGRRVWTSTRPQIRRSPSNARNNTELSASRRTNTSTRAQPLNAREVLYGQLRTDAERINSATALAARVSSNLEEESRPANAASDIRANNPPAHAAVAASALQENSFLQSWMPQRVELRDATSEQAEDEKAMKTELRRVEVLTELFATERTYVRDLDATILLFLEPCRERRILTSTQEAAIFSNLELIMNVNQEILRSLLRDVDNCGSIQLVNVGSVFRRMVDFLKIYSLYAANHGLSVKTVEHELRENKEFAAVCLDATQQPEAKQLDLSSFLIKPVQRLCKYPLLFRELLSVTPEDHSDFADLQFVYEQLTAVALFVNEHKRATENAVRMLWIKRHLVDLPKDINLDVISGVTENRRAFELSDRSLVRDGLVLYRNKKGRFKDYHLILLTDILIWARPTRLRRQLSFKCFASLEGVLINDSTDAEILTDADRDKGVEPELVFEILCVSRDGRGKYTLSANNMRDKKLWLENIRACVEKLHANNVEDEFDPHGRAEHRRSRTLGGP